MRKAHDEGRSASEVVRDFIDSYLAGQSKETRPMFLSLWKPAAAIGAASVAMMWAALAPAPSQATADLKSVFQMLDRNHDGVITVGEFMRDASDPRVEKMHHAHMNGTHAKEMGTAHTQMMEMHAKPSAQMLRSHFARMDANSNGSVTFAEFRAFHDEMKASHGH